MRKGGAELCISKNVYNLIHNLIPNPNQKQQEDLKTTLKSIGCGNITSSSAITSCIQNKNFKICNDSKSSINNLSLDEFNELNKQLLLILIAQEEINEITDDNKINEILSKLYSNIQFTVLINKNKEETLKELDNKSKSIKNKIKLFKLSLKNTKNVNSIKINKFRSLLRKKKIIPEKDQIPEEDQFDVTKIEYDGDSDNFKSKLTNLKPEPQLTSLTNSERFNELFPLATETTIKSGWTNSNNPNAVNKANKLINNYKKQTKTKTNANNNLAVQNVNNNVNNNVNLPPLPIPRQLPRPRQLPKSII